MIPCLNKADGTQTLSTDSVSRHLKGSWNTIKVTVPSGAVATQLGIDFTASGAFTAYVDGVAW